MTVIAVDPGPKQTAIVVWDGVEVLYKEILENEVALLAVHDLGTDYGPDTLVAVEMIASYGMAVGRDVFETCVFIGRILERTGFCNAKRVYRQPVKLWHCNSAKAKDSNVRQALIDKYGEPGTKRNPGATYGLSKDLWAAFAIATYITEAGDEAKFVEVPA